MLSNPQTRLLLLELVALLERTLAAHRSLTLPNAVMETDELKGLAVMADDTLARTYDALREPAILAPALRHPFFAFGPARPDLQTRMRARRAAVAPPPPAPTHKPRRPEFRL